MSEFTFELVPYEEGTTVGRAGDVGHLGRVAVERDKLYRPLDKGINVARLSGPTFPDTVFRGKRRSGQPSLFKAELTLDGRPAELRFNSRALRKEDRALRISYEGREYVYSSDGVGKAKVLQREGVRVSIEFGRQIPPADIASAGTVTGPADAVDLAIAIVLEEVNTDDLTVGGTVLSTPLRVLHSFSDGAE